MPTLYYMSGSAPCRAVLLVAKALHLDLELRTVDMRNGDHMTPEYLKLNPQHTVPTLEDNGFSMWESRAIITYLVNKYGKGSNLYPEDPQARAVVDQRLYFDIGTLYSRFAEYFYPQAFVGTPADSDKKAKVEEALKFLDQFLAGHDYVAGKHLTVADLSLVASVSTMEVSDVDFKKYAKIKRWYEMLQATVPGYKEANQDGLDIFNNMIKAIMKK